MTQELQPVPDAIEREVLVTAPLDEVFAFVREPGWWVNGGELREHDLEQDAANPAITYLTDRECGRFTIETVEERAPEFVAFRWLDGEGAADRAVQNTDTSFTLTPADGGTLVRVAEGGWTSVPLTQQVRDEYEGNCRGWEIELELLRAHFAG